MTERKLRAAMASVALAASVWTGCAAPAVPGKPVERGHRIDRETLEGLQRGVTTRAQALLVLGEPTRTVSNPEDGTTTMAWDYVHSDAKGTLAIMTVLKFGHDDVLLFKATNQSSQSH